VNIRYIGEAFSLRKGALDLVLDVHVAKCERIGSDCSALNYGYRAALGIEKVWETALLMLTELMLSYSDLDYGPVAEQIASHW
jgi:hypothetical protein